MTRRSARKMPRERKLKAINDQESTADLSCEVLLENNPASSSRTSIQLVAPRRNAARIASSEGKRHRNRRQGRFCFRYADTRLPLRMEGRWNFLFLKRQTAAARVDPTAIPDRYFLISPAQWSASLAEANRRFVSPRRVCPPAITARSESFFRARATRRDTESVIGEVRAAPRRRYLARSADVGSNKRSLLVPATRSERFQLRDRFGGARATSSRGELAAFPRLGIIMCDGRAGIKLPVCNQARKFDIEKPLARKT